MSDGSVFGSTNQVPLVTSGDRKHYRCRFAFDGTESVAFHDFTAANNDP